MSKAGDLAHGLKTPLAVLTHEAERAAAAGQHELAAAVSRAGRAHAAPGGVAPGARARGGVRRHARRPVLGRRVGGGAGRARCAGSTPTAALPINVRVPPEHSVRCQREDLDEMLGNLLDNACKWGKSRVTIESAAADQSIVITVDDDGSGIDPSMRDVVLQRGVRADEAAPGSGFGLAIVRDLAELYGGAIALDRSADGGVRAQLTLPAAG